MHDYAHLRLPLSLYHLIEPTIISFCAALVLQGVTYAACIHYISSAAREEGTGHGSALHQGGAPVNPMADASMWQDAFYLNAASQVR